MLEALKVELLIIQELLAKIPKENNLVLIANKFEKFAKYVRTR